MQSALRYNEPRKENVVARKKSNWLDNNVKLRKVFVASSSPESINIQTLRNESAITEARALHLESTNQLNKWKTYADHRKMTSPRHLSDPDCRGIFQVIADTGSAHHCRRFEDIPIDKREIIAKSPRPLTMQTATGSVLVDKVIFSKIKQLGIVRDMYVMRDSPSASHLAN